MHEERPGTAGQFDSLIWWWIGYEVRGFFHNLLKKFRRQSYIPLSIFYGELFAGVTAFLAATRDRRGASKPSGDVIVSDTEATALEVIICTYNNAAMLDGALSRLAKQRNLQGARWTCLVVNNNCTDDTEKFVRRYAAQGSTLPLRMVAEPEQGLTPASLRGVRSSKANWIALWMTIVFCMRTGLQAQ